MKTKDELLEELESIECKLSPENLHCDGEISRAQARLKEARLLEQRNRVLTQLAAL